MRLRATRLSATGNNARKATSRTYFADLLIVGGGGQGGGAEFGGGGGGGAGELIYLPSQQLVSGAYSVTIGAGGAITPGSLLPGQSGGSSLAFGYTAVGGGGGGTTGGSTANLGASGGSGGGSSATGGDNFVVAGGLSTAIAPGVGFDGGGLTKGMGVGARAGGGGGGSAGPGVTANTMGVNATWYAGKGGDGLPLSITGVSVRYAAGGGGGTRDFQSTQNVSPLGGALGGLGGGGNGRRSGQGGPASGFGCGGGGSGNIARATPGGAGSAGVVVIAYPDALPALTIGAGLTFTELSTRPGFRVYQITAGTGQITFN